MKSRKTLELYDKLYELKDELRQYRKSAEDGVEKENEIVRMDMEIGEIVEKLVSLLKKEGYTTLEVATRLGISESTVRILEG